MLIASKNGSITAAKLLSETDESWTLEVEKRNRSLSKTDSRQLAFNDMSEALKWSGGPTERIAHFAGLAAGKAAPADQVQSGETCLG